MGGYQHCMAVYDLGFVKEGGRSVCISVLFLFQRSRTWACSEQRKLAQNLGLVIQKHGRGVAFINHIVLYNLFPSHPLCLAQNTVVFFLSSCSVTMSHSSPVCLRHHCLIQRTPSFLTCTLPLLSALP